MATGKRFYWIKLRDSFMTSDAVDFMMSQPGGANYVVLYQMLCLNTINTGGRLSRQIGEIIIPYDVEKIRRDCKWFSTDTVRIALDLYKRFGLIYEDILYHFTISTTKPLRHKGIGAPLSYIAIVKIKNTDENASYHEDRVRLCLYWYTFRGSNPGHPD